MVAAGDVGDLPVPEAGLRISRSAAGGWEHVEIAGDLDLAGIPETEGAIADALAAEPRGVAIDLTDLTFLGSEGVRALLRARERAEEQGRDWRIVAGEGPARRLIELLGLGARLGLDGGPG